MLLHRIRIALFFVAAAVAVGAAQINKPWPPGLQQVSEDSPPISPEEALKKFYMPPGYRVELVASEPLIQDPVMIDWDGDGRMWAVEMPGYMPDINAKGEHAPIGKIVVLEDTNNDGRMDKRTVFQDGLVLARWLKVLDRGVLVAEPPNLWLFQDTNGDLRADRKELVTNQYGRREAQRRAQREQPAVGARQQHLHLGDRHRPAIEERQVRGAQDAVARPVGHHAGRCGTDFQEHERVGAARRSWFPRTTTSGTRISCARAAATNR